MAGFSTIAEVCDAEITDGNYCMSAFRKNLTGVTVTGNWMDFSVMTGTPPANYYASSPLTATVLGGSADAGMYVGPTVSPKIKFLRSLSAMITVTGNPIPMNLLLCDFLMYYPFIAQDDTSPQVMTNTLSLTRYTDGVGVRMVPVVQNAQTGGQTFFVTYTNSSGVSGRTSRTVTMGTSSVLGTVLTSSTATANTAPPFIPLQDGDIGVRSIDSVTMITGTDTGLFAIALCVPIASVSIPEFGSPVEVDFLRDYNIMPVIKDDAYLNFLALVAGSINTTKLTGAISVVWK